MRLNISTIKKTIWDLFEDAEATKLGRTLYNIIKSTTKYIRLTTKAKRAELLFGEKAGQQYLVKAEILLQKRITNLKAIKNIFKQIYENLGEGQEKKISELIGNGALHQFTLNTKKMYMLEFLKSNMSVMETKKALEHLDKAVATIEKFKKTEDVMHYLVPHIDELMAWQLPDEWLFTICLAAMAATSALFIAEIAILSTCISLKQQGKHVNCLELHRLMLLYFCGLRDSYLPD